jgi:inosose dehydratase
MALSLSRRRFLTLASQGAVSLAAGSLLARRARAADAPDPWGGFLMGMQSYTLRGFPLDKALEIIAELGLGSVEFAGIPTHFPLAAKPEEIARVQKKCAELKLKMLGHGVNRFTKDHEANRKVFEFAKLAGIKNLSADPDEDSFGSLEKLVAEFDIRIAIHNHGPKHRYNKVADVLNVIKDRDPRIGACADLGHYIRSAEDPVGAIRQFQGRLYSIHLKDFAEQQDKTTGVILGKGHLDLVGVFQALKKVQFPQDGCLAIEYEEKPKDPTEDLKACLAAVKEALGKIKG